jgi:hypothetical protein
MVTGFHQNPFLRRFQSTELLESDRPYDNHHEYLVDELRWLNRILAVQVARLRRVNFYENVKDFRSLFISDEEVDSLLAADIDASERDREQISSGEINELIKLAHDLREKIDRRVKESLAQDVLLPMRQLGKFFRLTELEIQTLVICLGPQIDARYEKLYAYLQNDINKKSPSKDLITELLVEEGGKRIEYIAAFNEDSPLIHFGLIEFIDSGIESFDLDSLLRIDNRIVQYLLGNSTVDQRIKADLHFFPSPSWDQVIISATFKDNLQKLLNYEISHNGQACIYLHGRAGVGKKTIAGALCEGLGFPLAVVDARVLLKMPESFSAKVKRILREGLLHPCVVCFEQVHELISLDEGLPGFTTTFLRTVQELGWITFLCSETPLPSIFLDWANIYPVEVPPQNYHEQVSLWKMKLNAINTSCDCIDVDQIATRFDLTGGQIGRVLLRAEKTAHVRDPENTTITLQDLVWSSRVQSQPKLTSLARRIEPKYCWQDIVLPKDQMSQLLEIVSQVKHRQIVMGNWGFGRKISLGRGLNALFSGSSGTGKTMAAEVIGNELDLDIYKIDLSAVVSKYIGETEKNLARLFDEAEHSNAILFFDEADALLGKRSEVKDAHDRFANIEIAFLLQKMEEYEGITILATNLKKNLDEAFIRRIQFIIDFPLPNTAHREKIWHKTFPMEVPLGADIDFAFLAKRFKLTGGNIRNISLRSAYFAAQEKEKVGMAHLIWATKRELQKMGVLYTEADFAGYAVTPA